MPRLPSTRLDPLSPPPQPMLDAERDTQGPAITATIDRAALSERIELLSREAGRAETRAMLEVVADLAREPDNVRDAVSTRLMEVFRLKTSRGAFGLLYELNSEHLVTQVASCLRRYGSRTDPRDVLQEVFFNIYRYPHRFNSEREDAFRVWSAMIVRNTVLKHLRSQGRAGRSEVPFEDLSDQPEERIPSPLRGAIDSESTRECGRVYLTYLHLYLRFYSLLSVRERRAIHLVEVGEKSYREAADELGIKLENLKMVIFRARRKIHRSMRRVFEGLPPDCRPARDPLPRFSDGDNIDTDPTVTDDRLLASPRVAGALGTSGLRGAMEQGDESIQSQSQAAAPQAGEADRKGGRS